MPSKTPSTVTLSGSPPARFRISTRIRAAGLFLAALYAFFLFGLYKTGYWLLGQNGKPLMLDFLPVWLAGKQALLGHAATAYDLPRFISLQDAVAGLHPGHFSWSYPPTYFLPAGLLANLPYAWAFIVWEATTLSCCLAASYCILRDPAVPILILACPASALNAFVGQNGFLTAALTGLALLLLERRPWLAGCFIGALSYKPQLVVLFPIILIVDKRWKALAGAAAAAVGLGLIAGLAVGMDTWLAFPAALLHTGTMITVKSFTWSKLQSVYGLARSVGLGAVSASSAHAIVAIAVTVATAALWRSRKSYDLKAAAAAAAALAITPYLFSYDLPAIVIAALFLQRDRIERGSLRGETLAGFALFGGLIGMLVAAAAGSNLAMGSVIVLGLLALIFRRALATLPLVAARA